MNIWLAVVILKSTLFLSVGAALIVMTKVERVQRTRLFRVACVLVLLQGCCWFQLSVPHFDDSSPTSFVDVDSAQFEWTEVEATRQTVIEPSEILPLAISPSVADVPWFSVKQREWGAAAFVAIWLCGIVVLFTRSSLRYCRFHRRLKLDSAPSDLVDAWHDVCGEIGIGATDILVSENVGPAVMQRGPRSVLVIPVDLLDQLSPVQLRGILIHESTHIARRDIWKSLAVRILAVVHWFNPMAWMIVRRFDEAAEWACDAKCQSLLSDDITEFAKAILENVSPARLPSLSLGVRGHCMAVRIRRMLFPERIKESKMRIGLLCIAFAVITTVNAFEPVSRTLADDQKDEPAELFDQPVESTVPKDMKLPSGVELPPAVVHPRKAGSRATQRNYIETLKKELKELSESETGLHIPNLVEDLKRKISLNEKGIVQWDVEIWECDEGALKAFSPPQKTKPTISQASHPTETPELKPIGDPEKGGISAVVFRQTDILNKLSQPPPNPQIRPEFVGRFPQPIDTGLDADSVLSNALHRPNGETVTFVGCALVNDKYKDQLNELRKKGKATVKSQPHLVTKPGVVGAYLNGGAFPIVVPAGGNNVAIEWRAFGTSMEVKSIRLDTDRLRSEVQIEVSERDDSNAVVVGGITVPGLTVRRANTIVEHKSGETFVIRGLITTAKSDKPNSEMVCLIKPTVQTDRPRSATRKSKLGNGNRDVK